MKLSILFYEFIEDKKLIDGLKDNTLRAYIYFVLKRFIHDFLHDPDVSDLDIQDLRKYVAYLRSTDMKSKSIHTYYNHVKVFISYLYRNHYTDVDILRDGPTIRVYNNIKEIYYDDDLKCIFSELLGDSLEKIIIKLCFAILIDTGIRPSELCSIQIQDVNFHNSTILIHGSKTYADRIVPISLPVRKYITKYLSRRIAPIDPVDKDYLLISRRSKTKLTHMNIKNYVNNYVKKACGIKRGTAYLFRHSFATRSLYLGTDLYKIKTILGHTRVTTTENYLRMVSQLQMSDHVDISDTSQLLMSCLFK